MRPESQSLSAEAFSILVSDLEGHGNVLSTMHRAALFELVCTFTGYLAGTDSGRRAFGLPTGLGKTSAVVAHLTAMHRLGHLAPVSVAASKIEALCAMKRDLIAHGVPEALIGLKHSSSDASEPSTGDESRVFQLVTHSRVRSGRDFGLFGEHLGVKRPLCIYDETLLRSDTFAFSDRSMRKALELLKIELEDQVDALSASLLAYLSECSGIVTAALLKLQEPGADDLSNGLPVDLPFRDESIIDAYRHQVSKVSRGLSSWATELDSLLAVSQESLQVLRAEQGGGVIAVREAVPSGLRNVVILDASTAIRELIRLDPTIRTEQSFTAEQLKSYEAVNVHQLLAAGGRGSIEGSFKAKEREASAVSKEVIEIIRQRQAVSKAFLIFSFLPRRGQVDVQAELRNDLARAGIDLEQKTSEGRNRFEFRTWGSEAGENGLEHCETVIMAGVLHRSHLDIAAAVKGQAGNLREPTPSDRLRLIIQSEIAHVVLQGASRGSCRRITDGKAHPMWLYLIHKDASLKGILDRVMPGAVWHYPEPSYLRRAHTEGKAAAMFALLVTYLGTLRGDEVSSRKAKADLRISGDPASAVWKRSLSLLDPEIHGWELVERSLRRINYGFEAAPSAS